MLPTSSSSFIVVVIVTVFVVIVVSVIVISAVCAFSLTISSCCPALVAPPSLVAPSLSHRNAPLLLPLSRSCIATRLSLDKDTDNNDNTNKDNVLTFLSSYETIKINPSTLQGMNPTKVGCCIINEVAE